MKDTLGRRLFIEMKGVLASSFSRGSMYIMATYGFASITGFIFWFVVIKLYAQDIVGESSAIVSIAGLMSSIAALGMTASLIRFLKESHTRAKLVSRIMQLSLLISLALAVGTTALSGISSELFGEVPFQKYSFGFVVLVVLSCIVSLQTAAMIGLGTPKSAFFQNTIIGSLKLVLPIPLIAFGDQGIIWSLSSCNIAGVIVGYALIAKGVKREEVSLEELNPPMKTMLGFSLAVFIGTVFMNTPGSLIPAIVLDRLDASSAASFYLMYTIVSAIGIISGSLSLMYLSQGARDVQREKDISRKASRMLVLVFAPIVGLTFIARNEILGIFGESYAQNSDAFAIMLAFLLVNGVLTIDIAKLRYEFRQWYAAAVSIIFCASALTTTFHLLEEHGLDGAAIGLLTGSIVALAIKRGSDTVRNMMAKRIEGAFI